MQGRALYFPLRTEMLLVDTCPLLRVSQPAAAPCWAPAALAGSGELGVAGYDVEVRGEGGGVEGSSSARSASSVGTASMSDGRWAASACQQLASVDCSDGGKDFFIGGRRPPLATRSTKPPSPPMPTNGTSCDAICHRMTANE